MASNLNPLQAQIQPLNLVWFNFNWKMTHTKVNHGLKHLTPHVVGAIRGFEFSPAVLFHSKSGVEFKSALGSDLAIKSIVYNRNKKHIPGSP